MVEVVRSRKGFCLSFKASLRIFMVRAGLGLQDLQEFEVSKLVWGAGLRGSSPKLPRSFISNPAPS